MKIVGPPTRAPSHQSRQVCCAGSDTADSQDIEAHGSREKGSEERQRAKPEDKDGRNSDARTRGAAVRRTEDAERAEQNTTPRTQNTSKIPTVASLIGIRVWSAAFVDV